MPILNVHPATRFLVWLLVLIGVQYLSGTALVAAFLLLPLVRTGILKRGWRLIWRARWLLVSLLVIFSWGVAGEPLWNSAVAPTREGLLEGFTHFGRLLLVLMVVAAFLEAMPLSELLPATHTLLKPLQHFGLDPDRGVVRLMLVLRYVETLPRPSDWRNLLDVPASSVSELIEVKQQEFCWLDYAVTFGLAVTVPFLCFR